MSPSSLIAKTQASGTVALTDVYETGGMLGRHHRGDGSGDMSHVTTILKYEPRAVILHTYAASGEGTYGEIWRVIQLGALTRNGAGGPR